MCSFYCPLGKKWDLKLFSWGYRWKHSATHLSKIFERLSGILLCQVFCWIGNNTSKVFSLSYDVNCNETKWRFEIPICFWFQWKSLSNLFLFKFWNFLVLHLGCGYVTWFYDKNDFKSPLSFYPMSVNKNLRAKTAKYIPKFWERSPIRQPNLNFIRVIKIHLLIHMFYTQCAERLNPTLFYRQPPPLPPPPVPNPIWSPSLLYFCKPRAFSKTFPTISPQWNSGWTQK